MAREGLIPEITVADALRALGEDDIPETAMLRGYVLLAEWEPLDGERFMTQDTAPTQPVWQTRGYLDWLMNCVDEEEDD